MRISLREWLSCAPVVALRARSGVCFIGTRARSGAIREAGRDAVEDPEGVGAVSPVARWDMQRSELCLDRARPLHRTPAGTVAHLS